MNLVVCFRCTPTGITLTKVLTGGKPGKQRGSAASRGGCQADRGGETRGRLLVGKRRHGTEPPTSYYSTIFVVCTRRALRTPYHVDHQSQIRRGNQFSLRRGLKKSFYRRYTAAEWISSGESPTRQCYPSAAVPLLPAQGPVPFPLRPPTKASSMVAQCTDTQHPVVRGTGPLSNTGTTRVSPQWLNPSAITFNSR